MKVLNLYAGIGGNRKYWRNVDVTAIEIRPQIAKIYRHFYPKDQVLVEDAHNFLLNNYNKFDFIWSSPPCQTHSRMRKAASKRGDYLPKYPDMKLYEEIIFLQHYCDCKWVIENVKGFYEPLIKPQIVGRHYFWCNFHILPFQVTTSNIRDVTTTTTRYGFNIASFHTEHRKDHFLRSIIEPKLGLHVFECAFHTTQQKLTSIC